MSALKELEKIIDETAYEDIEDDLIKNGFSYIEIDSSKEMECCSEIVKWDVTYEVAKSDEKFRVYLGGTAIAEISYERWVDTFEYNIEDFSISIEGN